MSKALAKEKADHIEAIARGEEIDEPAPLTPRPVGRPTAYKPEFVDQAIKLCNMGATDAEMAEFFDVSTATFYTWMKVHPEFLEAIQVSKDAHDNRVERSLYQKAIGYERTVQRATPSGNVVTLKEFFPPDTASAIFWLKNRRSQKWKDRQDHNHNHTLTLSQEFETFMRQVHAQVHGPEPLKLESHSSESPDSRPLDFSYPPEDSKSIP